jgi:hypothetical protein
MEQRNQMLRELRLNKKESMGVVSVNNSHFFLLNVRKVKRRKKQINEFLFFFARCRNFLLVIIPPPARRLSRKNQW